MNQEIYRRSGEFYNENYNINPDIFFSYLNLAFHYKMENNIQAAVKNYEKACALEKNYKLFYELGECYELLKDFKKAIYNYNASITFNTCSNNDEKKLEKLSYCKIVSLYRYTGKEKEALHMIEMLNERYPDFKNNQSTHFAN